MVDNIVNFRGALKQPDKDVTALLSEAVDYTRGRVRAAAAIIITDDEEVVVVRGPTEDRGLEALAKLQAILGSAFAQQVFDLG